MKCRRLLPVLVLAACAHAPASPAAPPEACKADAARLCSTDPFLIPCLKSQADALSAACRLAMATPGQVAGDFRQAAEDFSEACRVDAASLCPGVLPASGKLYDCLRTQSLSLSDSCQMAVRVVQEKKDQFQAVCGKDAARLCPGVEPGQGRVVACMKPRSSELDSACRALLFP